jgi:hypothetical protein
MRCIEANRVNEQPAAGAEEAAKAVLSTIGDNGSSRQVI